VLIKQESIEEAFLKKAANINGVKAGRLAVRLVARVAQPESELADTFRRNLSRSTFSPTS
jgi:hypothetical protein